MDEERAPDLDGAGDGDQCVLSPASVSRKLAGGRGKVVENCDPVVPRKLRSAMNKRSCQAASSLLSDSKRKRLASEGAQPSLVSVGSKIKQVVPLIKPTKDEKEVAEALFALATIIPVREPIEVDNMSSYEISKMKVTSFSLPKGSKEGDMKYSASYLTAEATNPSSAEESSKQPVKAEDSVMEQTITTSRSKNIDLESNGTRQFWVGSSLTSRNDPANTICPMDSVKLSNPHGSPRQLYFGNGVLKSIQLDVVPSCKLNIELASAPRGGELPSSKPRPDGSSPFMCLGETTPDIQHTSGHGHCSKNFSKAAVPPDSGRGACPPSSTRIVQLGNKFSQVSADKKSLSKRCTTHVYISHLIDNHQKKEKTPSLGCLSDHLKSKEENNPVTQNVNETTRSRSGLCSKTSVGASERTTQRNLHEARNQMFQNHRSPQSQTSKISDTYAQQKQVFDFLSRSATSGTSSSTDVAKSSGQLHVPFLHSQVPHRSISPLGFPHGPVPFLNPATAYKQQFQLPRYSGNPFYGQHMVHTGSATKLQQHLVWQSQMVNSGILKWPSSALHVPPSSSEMLSAFSLQNNQHLQQHQLQPILSFSSSSRGNP